MKQFINVLFVGIFLMLMLSTAQATLIYSGSLSSSSSDGSPEIVATQPWDEGNMVIDWRVEFLQDDNVYFEYGGIYRQVSVACHL